MREVLNEYSQEVREITRDTVRSVARTCRKEIRAGSPRKSGEYAKGWRIKETVGRLGDVSEKIYNAKKPGLVHLLEHGHAKVDGGRVEGTPPCGPRRAEGPGKSAPGSGKRAEPMTQNDLVRQLEGAGLPLAYRAFRSKTGSRPSCVTSMSMIPSSTPTTSPTGPRGTTRWSSYTARKDPELEAAVERALSGLAWEKEEEYLADQQVYEVRYEFEL